MRLATQKSRRLFRSSPDIALCNQPQRDRAPLATLIEGADGDLVSIVEEPEVSFPESAHQPPRMRHGILLLDDPINQCERRFNAKDRSASRLLCAEMSRDPEGETTEQS